MSADLRTLLFRLHVAQSSFEPLNIPENFKIGSLESRCYQESPGFSYPSGAYGCVVFIDKLTGNIKVDKNNSGYQTILDPKPPPTSGAIILRRFC